MKVAQESLRINAQIIECIVRYEACQPNGAQCSCRFHKDAARVRNSLTQRNKLHHGDTESTEESTEFGNKRELRVANPICVHP